MNECIPRKAKLLRLLQSDDYSFPLAYLIATTFWCVQVSVRNRKDGNFLCVSTAMSGHSGQFVSELLRWFLSLSDHHHRHHHTVMFLLHRSGRLRRWSLLQPGSSQDRFKRYCFLNTCFVPGVTILVVLCSNCFVFFQVLLALGDYMNVQCHACIGGTNVGEDIRKLDYGQHVVSGTPGRVFGKCPIWAAKESLYKVCLICLSQENWVVFVCP